MVKLVWRGIRANLGRLALTLVSVVLGVSFVSGSFVLADSLRSVFGQIAEDAFAGVDAQVRAPESELQSADQVLARFDDSIVDDVAALPEVEYAEGGVAGFESVYSLDAEGEVVRPQGPPVFAFSWAGPSPVSSFTIIEGVAPSGNQVALDQAQVDNGGFSLNDTVSISTVVGEVEEFELSAIIDFGDGGTAGAYFLLFDVETAQRVLNSDGRIDSIVINGADGISQDDLLASIDAVLTDGGTELEVVSGETVLNEQQEDFDSFIGIFGNILLGFAIVVLFVSTFIIYNTFAILVGQRTQQLGLLRSIGASKWQVRGMVMFESLIIGLVASVIGMFGGLGVAWLLKRLFSTGGNSFPDGPLELLPRTIIVVVAVGLGVTVASALLPAFRASKVTPLEAVRDGGRKDRSLRFRIIAGSLVLVPGLVALFAGMFADVESTAGRLTLIGIGAALSFIGVSMLSALFAARASHILGWPPFLALGSLIGGVLLFVLGLAAIAGGIFVIVLAFGVDGFVPLGLLQIVGGFLIIGLGYLFLRAGPPAVVDGLQQLQGVFSGGSAMTITTLARNNAARNPQRTAATSTALMIGLALITGVAVLTASILATFDELLEDALTADLFIFEPNGIEFSPVLAEQLASVEEVDVIAAFRQVAVAIDGESNDVAGFDTDTGSTIVNLDVIDGVENVSTSGIAVLEDTAKDQDLEIGDTVGVEFEDGFSTDLEIEAIFADNSVAGSDWVMNRDLTSQHAGDDAIGFIGLTYKEGVDVEAARQSVEALTGNFPQLSVQDNTEFQEQIQSQVNQLQIVTNGLLVLCLVVAFFGIVNTMALSILERTREIGLLRAVGMTRDQLRSAIRSEAVLVSVFGALLGVVMGLLLGWAAVVAIPDSFISTVGIPWLQLVVFLLVGIVIGLVAAYFPAKRAAQLDVLDAISQG